MRKLFTFILALVAGAGTLFAQSGTCGPNLTWELNNGVLTISGSGVMTDYSIYNKAPWNSLSSSVKSIIIGNNVTSIGDETFRDCPNYCGYRFFNDNQDNYYDYKIEKLK